MQMTPRLFLCFITLSFLTSPIQSSTPSGFSISLIHRDSYLSPYHNASKTYHDSLRDSLSRDMARYTRIFTQTLASSPSTIQSPLTPDHGGYLMKISVGTPPQDFLAVADTGSDLTWIQCKPCIQCYKQVSPVFDPKKSSTYKNQPCQSKVCQRLLYTCGDKNHCHYEEIYGDRSFSTGDISLESFTFGTTSGKPVVLPKISFGCGHKNGGNFDKFMDGIVGLGNSDLSIINQLSRTINGKFSYCMVPPNLNATGKISFGSNAIVSGSGAQTTPFFTRDVEEASLFYFLNLESASIGETHIKFETKTYNANGKRGNIIIDSGTTVTYLPSDFYEKIEHEFKRIISLTPVEADPGLSLCYKKVEGFEERVPTITFHFTGADWKLDILNTMVDMGDGKLCFTIAAGGGLAIFGNMQQMNYLVGYDLNAKTLSFKKIDCAKH